MFPNIFSFFFKSEMFILKNDKVISPIRKYERYGFNNKPGAGNRNPRIVARMIGSSFLVFAWGVS